MNGDLLADRYRLLDLIGRGGVGEVWRGQDLQLDRTVAVKVVRTEPDEALISLERFRREARAAARLSHPNIVATYDVGSDGDREFLVMELVRGRDLAHLLRAQGLPPADRVAGLALQAASGLDAAHAAGIVHRDIKPANLLLAGGDTVKITDFGIARIAGAEKTGPALLGTAAYVSPEQVRGEPATAASDRYALGCVLYELLAGRTPFTGTQHEVLTAHVEAEPIPVLELRPDAGAGLAELVMRLLAKDPAARPASEAEAQASLAAAAQSGEATRVLQVAPAAAPEAPEALSEVWHDEPDDDRSTDAGVSPMARKIAAVAAVAAAVLVVILAASQLRSESDNAAQAGPVPSKSAPVTTRPSTPKPTPKVTPTREPTRTPSSKPTKTPTKKPTTRPPGQAGQLQTLAGLLRADAEGRTGRELRSAARDLDQSAAALTRGDRDEASDQFRDAVRKATEAQRHGWRPTPQEVSLFNSLGSLWRVERGDGDRDSND